MTVSCGIRHVPHSYRHARIITNFFSTITPGSLTCSSKEVYLSLFALYVLNGETPLPLSFSARGKSSAIFPFFIAILSVVLSLRALRALRALKNEILPSR
jgi:hypothetical protein